MADKIPKELQKLLSSYKDKNVGSAVGVYIPKEASVTYEGFPPNDPELQGFVSQDTPEVVHVRGSKNPSLFDAKVLLHELGHTAQFLNKKDHSKMKGLFFRDYGEESYPNPLEILATLRAEEALMNRGRTLWDKPLMKNGIRERGSYSDNGQGVVDKMKQLNPRMTEEGIKRYLDLRLYPEHQLMHEFEDPKEESLVNKLLSPFLR